MIFWFDSYVRLRSLDPTKIIVTGKRIRFSFSGTSDIAQFDPNVANPLAVVNMHQQVCLTSMLYMPLMIQLYI